MSALCFWKVDNLQRKFNFQRYEGVPNSFLRIASNILDSYPIKTRSRSSVSFKDCCIEKVHLEQMSCSSATRRCVISGEITVPFFLFCSRMGINNKCISWFNLCWNFILWNPKWSHITDKFPFVTCIWGRTPFWQTSWYCMF